MMKVRVAPVKAPARPEFSKSSLPRARNIVQRDMPYKAVQDPKAAALRRAPWPAKLTAAAPLYPLETAVERPRGGEED